MSPSPPSPDLPADVAEKILELLPLSDYVRFSAVCRRWRSIQIDHRRRHAPSPPPMLKLPWLIPCDPEEEMVSCYSPFEDRSYRIRLPNHYDNPYCCTFAHGWLFRYAAIVNPISGVFIPLPKPFPLYHHHIGFVAALLPPPDYIAFVIKNRGELYFFQRGDLIWTRLMLPLQEPEIVNKAVAFGGKLYCICSEMQGMDSKADHLVVVDPVQIPAAVKLYRMADWDIMPPSDGMEMRFGWCECVVESGGELLLVREIYVIPFQTFRTVGYQVFRPDLKNRMWMRVGSLGDRVLILRSIYSVSLVAADVGLKGNCIYAFNDILDNDVEAAWNIFDLGAGTLTEVAFPNPLWDQRRSQQMFMPSIC